MTTTPDLATPAAGEAARPRLTITHTSADGTLLEGSVKGDGAWEAIKTAQDAYRFHGKYWRYFPSIRAVGIARSRDQAPKLGLIDTAADVLREAGFDVDIVIDGTPRAMEHAEADRADRMDDRAAALHDKADRRAAESDAHYATAQAIGDHIPMGQPVLAGHHSERGHRRDLRRMDTAMRASVTAAAEAEDAQQRAETAERHMEARNNPRRVYRHIRTQQADLRKIQRELTPCELSGRKLKPETKGRTLNCRCYRFDFTVGDDLAVPEHGAATGRYREELLGRQAHLEESIRYWQEALAAAKAAGADVPPDTDAIQKDWWVRVTWTGKWYQVTRVNKVTVTVRDNYGNGGPDFPRKIALDDIREIRETNPSAPLTGPDLDAALAALDAADAAKSTPTPEPAPAPEPTPAARSGLSDAAWVALRGAAATERSVHLATTVLPPAVYAEVDRALSRIGGGGRWDRRERAHVYPRDPRPGLEALVGQRAMPPASAADDKRLAYFPTPPTLAARIAAALRFPETRPHPRILEPSAGDGALVRAVRDAHPGAYVDAVEVDDTRVALICRDSVREFVHVWSARFQDWLDGSQHADIGAPHPSTVPYDAVVMNPPYREVGDPQAWATHFELAWDLLAPGGQMVAVLPASYRYSERHAPTRIRGLVAAAAGTVEDLPDDTFKGAGTSASTVLVTARKP